jgi:tetratricopeptide (TPR) repeat protein
MSVEDLFRECTVRVDGGPKPGAGFFIAPGLVITCAHVAGDNADGLRIVAGGRDVAGVRRVRGLSSRGRPISDLDDYPDIAVLELADEIEHQCVAIDHEWPMSADRFQSYGYPLEGGSVNLTPAMLVYRGIQGDGTTRFIDLMSDTVKRGMSGGGLLKLSTGAVCGVIVATRSATSPDGGLAISWAEVADELADVLTANREFHRRDRRWAEAAAEQRASRIRFRIPQLTQHFLGRSRELEQVHRALAADRRAVVVVAITGMGGVGKSQLAAAYVQDHADEYEIVAWIAAEDGGAAELAKLAEVLGVSVEGLTPGERADRAVDWLASTERSWLLVLDNVTDAKHLANRVPGTGDGRILVTSRNPQLTDVAEVIRIDVFSRETAIDYLLERAPRSGGRESAGRSAEALGGLPLALAHAGAYCGDRDISFDEYHDLLEGLPPASLFDESPEASYQQTVASTWQPSIAAAQERSPLSRSVLAMAAYLAPDAIPISLFDVLVERETGVLAKKQLHDAIEGLRRYSLIQPEEIPTTFKVHRLLQRVVRADQSEASDRGAHDAATALSTAFPIDADTPSAWPLCADLAPHLISLAHAFPDTINADWGLVSALNRLMSFLRESGALDLAMSVGARSVDLAERLLGADHPSTISARASLASAYYPAGRLREAIGLQERVLADSERVLGPDHLSTLTARGSLALSYNTVGRTGEAIELQERVLADRARVLGDQHPQTIIVRNNLALSYKAAGRIREAIELHQRALADSEQVLGDEDPDTIAVRGNLASCYYLAGRWDEATELRERVLAERERVLGDEHFATMTARSELAMSYSGAGRVAEAVELQQRVLAERERVSGINHPDTVTARGNLAVSYSNDGRVGEAIELQERVVADTERGWGPRHPFTLIALSNLATYYRAAERVSEAIEIQQLVLAASEEVLGTGHQSTIMAKTELARSYVLAGRVSEAIPLQERVVVDGEPAWGAQHFYTIAARADLAASYYVTGRWGEAAEVQRRVVADAEQVLGTEHSYTIRAREHLAQIRNAAQGGQ